MTTTRFPNGIGGGNNTNLDIQSDSDILLTTNDGDLTWTLGADGTTIFPNNTIDSGTNSIELKSSSYSSLWFHSTDGVWQSNPISNENAYVYVQDNGAYIQNYRGADGNDGDTWDHTWEFGNTGNLTLPQGGTISETTVGINPTIVIKPAEADSPNQALYIKGGLPLEPGPDDYHLHLTTGDLTDTSIIVGTDDHNIRTTVNGDIELNSYNYDTDIQHTLTFDTDGAITVNDAFAIKTSTGIPTGAVTKTSDNQGWDESNVGTNLPTTGGTGTGLTVDVVDGGSFYSNITINTPGTGYTDGDELTVTRPDVSETFTISVPSNTWQFGTTGNLTFPDNEVQATAYSGGQGHMMMIDTNRTDTYTEVGNADKPFKTFAAAIAAATASSATAFTFVLMGCTVTENVNFNGAGLTAITIATSCRSVISGNITIAGNPELSQLVVRNIEIGGTFTLTGDATSEQMNSCSFYNVSFSGPVNITATNATAFYEVAFFSTVNFTNLSYLYINGAQFNDDWTIGADDTGTYPIPSRGINPGTGGSLSIVFGTIANNVYLVKGGTAAYVFQPHMTRLGRTTGTYTIPSGWTVSAYGADFRGNWTNNGAMGLKISGTDNRVLGTAPSYSSIVGGDRIIADLAPASSKGVAGDREGMIAASGSYLYICTSNYTDGVSDIWSRTAIATSTW